jgi:glycosyltransferase involved in cell wall biosynthesis
VTLFLPAEGVLADRFRVDGVPSTIVPAPAALRRHGRGTVLSRARATAALPRYWWQLSRRLRGRVDILHVNDHRGLILAGPAARVARVPFVWHVHTPSPSWILNTVGARLASAVVVASRSIVRDSPGLVVSSPAIHVVPLALPEKLRNARPVTPGTRPIVVTAGRLHEVKGFDTLLDAAVLVRRSIPDVEVVIFGSPQAGHEAYALGLQQRARDLGLEGGGVTFRGYHDDLAEQWQGAWVYVQPSRREAFGLAALEAMALGLPVIASRVGGLEENVADGSTGILVPPEDPEALSAAIVRVIQDRQLAQGLATGGLEWARTTYTLERFVGGIDAIYNSVLGVSART